MVEEAFVIDLIIYTAILGVAVLVFLLWPYKDDDDDDRDVTYLQDETQERE